MKEDAVGGGTKNGGFKCERVHLLSNIPGNRTVGFRRSKKRKPSTRSRLRVDVRPEKFQFMEKWQNRNFNYEIVITVKNP